MQKCLAHEFNDVFLKEFKKESDRACVILTCSIIDLALETMLKLKLVKSTKRDDTLFNGANAPISTFSAKIDLAYRLGLISKKLRRDINIMRKIRNSFAHDILGCNFDNPTVRNLVNELKRSTQIVERNQESRKHFDEGLRGDFQMIASQIIWYFWTTRFIKTVTLIQEVPPEWMYGIEKVQDNQDTV